MSKNPMKYSDTLLHSMTVYDFVVEYNNFIRHNKIDYIHLTYKVPTLRNGYDVKQWLLRTKENPFYSGDGGARLRGDERDSNLGIVRENNFDVITFLDQHKSAVDDEPSVMGGGSYNTDIPPDTSTTTDFSFGGSDSTSSDSGFSGGGGGSDW